MPIDSICVAIVQRIAEPTFNVSVGWFVALFGVVSIITALDTRLNKWLAFRKLATEIITELVEESRGPESAKKKLELMQKLTGRVAEPLRWESLRWTFLTAGVAVISSLVTIPVALLIKSYRLIAVVPYMICATCLAISVCRTIGVVRSALKLPPGQGN